MVDRAIAATVSAIEIYNKPDFSYRAETFCILAINGWELLFKAKWLKENNNKIHSLYEKYADKNKDGKKSKKLKIRRTKSKNPITHSINHLGNKLVEQGHLEQNAWTNIEVLLELRNSSVHFYYSSRDFSTKLQEIGTASLRNFVKLVAEWFKRDLSEYDFFLMPLSFMELPTHTEAIVSNKEEKNFLIYLTQLETQAADKDSSYSVTINLEVKLMRSKANEAIGVRIVDSTNTDAPEVRVTEEQDLESYSWNYKKLRNKCNERYSDFKLDKKFHNLKKSICGTKKESVCKVRHLNPRNTKSNSMTLYRPEIMREFDKHYTKREK